MPFRRVCPASLRLGGAGERYSRTRHTPRGERARVRAGRAS